MGKAETIAIPKPTRFQHILPRDVVKAMCGITTDWAQHSRSCAALLNIYFRFNVEQGMRTIGLGQWEQLDGVATHTDQYMRMQEVDQKLDSAVSAIWEHRALIPTVQIGMEAAWMSLFHTLNPLPVS
jgi:hypothetical protein